MLLNIACAQSVYRLVGFSVDTCIFFIDISNVHMGHRHLVMDKQSFLVTQVKKKE